MANLHPRLLKKNGWQQQDLTLDVATRRDLQSQISDLPSEIGSYSVTFPVATHSVPLVMIFWTFGVIRALRSWPKAL